MKLRITHTFYRLSALLLCISILFTMAQAADSEPVITPVQADTAAFGSAANITTASWQNDALSEAECKALLNAQELHPQPTGWKELDQAIENLLAPYAGQDTYTKLCAAYDWLVKNITYSWYGYSKQTAPAYEYFTQLDYLRSMTYTSCMKKSIPDDMANRTMHIFSAKSGVCYDYAIALAVIARYIGIESYVRTGYFSFEAFTGAGHHGWTVLVLNGAEYIFDSQRDARNWEYNGLNHYYFGITQAKATRYYPSYAAADAAANPARDASMLKMTEDREIASAHVWNTVTQAATCTQGGTTTSTCKLCGKVQTSSTAALGHSWNTVTRAATCTQEGITTSTCTRCGKVQTSSTAALGHSWDQGAITTPATDTQDGTATYTCTRCGETRTITMPAGGSPFIDVQNSSQYYYEPVLWASSNNIAAGIDEAHFEPSSTCTRAQIVAFLYRMAGQPEVTGENPFTDVAESSWYYNAVLWGYQNGIVYGMTDSSFCPDSTCTRAQVVAFLWRYAGSSETDTTAADTFSDISANAWYYHAVLWGRASQIVYGTTDTTFEPSLPCTRAQVVAFMYRVAQNL